MAEHLPLLEEMAGLSLERARQARASCPEAEMSRQAADALPAPPVRFDDSGFDLIAELKLNAPSASNSKGDSLGIRNRVIEYAAGGATAVSVLTEPSRFGGSLDHLRASADVLREQGVPVMRKDFLLDPYQLMEARAAGAGGVLLIVRMLSDFQLSELLDCADKLGLFVLLESFDLSDLERVRGLVAGKNPADHGIWLGLNTRDLSTLRVDPSQLESLMDEFPKGWLKVAESGILNAADARYAAGLGYDMALVGTALMQTDRPAILVDHLLKSGRDAAAFTI
ncbi:MAG: indole-3-glycerol phosphate synthase TrpC [Planctomycetota bacterium]|jgi:indole-3-glycerol phosphate synthase